MEDENFKKAIEKLDEKLPAWGEENGFNRVRIERAFNIASPSPTAIPRHEAVINWGRQFALILVETCPNSEELDNALTRLQECVMWANEAIARKS